MVVRGDVLIVLSYSGASDEILAILPAMKRISIPIIAITAGAQSDLARYAEVVLDVSVEREMVELNKNVLRMRIYLAVLGAPSPAGLSSALSS